MFTYKGLGEEWQETVTRLPAASRRQFDTGSAKDNDFVARLCRIVGWWWHELDTPVGLWHSRARATSIGFFSKYGFEVELTKRSRDGGRDIIAIQSILGIKSKFIIEFRCYSKENPVSVELVRSLHGVQMAEGANKSILATTSRFTPDAIKFAPNKTLQSGQCHSKILMI